MKGNKGINIVELQEKFAAIQAELKKALDAVESDDYKASFGILSKVTKYIVENCEGLGLALENVPFDGFDGPKFWRTLNQCWIFSLEHAASCANKNRSKQRPQTESNSESQKSSEETDKLNDGEDKKDLKQEENIPIFSAEYIVNLQQDVVAWSESLACYGLVDYEMGFWETDIMDTLESIRKAIDQPVQ
ncbi:hypothetical protein AYI69_g4338 [Smittium culicis]|uniref:Uncharacterized protein n=1 Tax=Smittium culicis TaxID=133412 RepID=A0A1R1YEI4_9FUNG|nr:hypothetical protein AYI69_g4338 [Smittium culicis]